MLALLFDHNVNRSIIQALGARVPELDGMTLAVAGLSRASDQDVLDWAARHQRIVVTHDIRTMVGYAWDRIHRLEPMPGLFVVSQAASIRAVVDDLELRVRCSHEGEWNHQVVFVAR